MRPLSPSRLSRPVRRPPPALSRGLALGVLLSAAWTCPALAQDAPPHKSLLPLWADAAKARGAPLPLPFGVGVVAVSDRQGVFGDHLSVRLAKGQPPPDDATLIAVAPVSFDNVGSTRGLQVKADVWVLPFLNLFVSLGQVDGDIAIDVVIDADALLPPPICRPAAPCGVKRLHFDSPLDNTTTTVGATLVYGSPRWFVGLTGARTISVADKDRSDIKSTNIGLRGGPRLTLDHGIRLEPYVGINYFRLDTEVRGSTALPDAFADGDALAVRYDARVRNVDDHSLTLGLNAEIGRRIDVQGEYGHADGGDRFILSTAYRF